MTDEDHGTRTFPIDAADGVSIAFRRGTGALATSDVREFGDRHVVWVEFETGDELTRLSAETSALVAAAAETAERMHLPLVIVISTSGADIVEGVAALHAWGQVAATLTRCSGVVPRR